MNSTGAGESPDWREVWRGKKVAQRDLKGFGQAENFWEDQEFVRKFSRSQQEGSSNIPERIAAMDIRPGDRVLDIGAGPGTFAVPLAAWGCEVTAIEPSARMRQALQEYADRAGVDAIQVIPCRWEDVTAQMLAPPYDVVLASHSLLMDDIVDAVRKMDSFSCRHVYLTWFLTHPLWTGVVADLWPHVHGCEYIRGPTADILWNALVQSGIFANITVRKVSSHHTYADMNEALDEFTFRLKVKGEAHRELIRDYIERNLTRTGHGLEIPGDFWDAMIWWKKEGES
jgi:SAM-dependent methyltransferase